MRDLLQKLEQATSRGDIDASTLDEETVQLREGWLALERILDESQQRRYSPEPAPPETALPETAPIATVSIAPAPIAPTRRSAGRWQQIGWMLAGTTALSAAIFAGWYVASRFSVFQNTPRPMASDSDSHEIQPFAGMNASASDDSNLPLESLQKQEDNLASGSEQSKVELAWDDALDDPLARAGYAIWQARGIAPSRDQAWEYLSSELQLISSDLEAESL